MTSLLTIPIEIRNQIMLEVITHDQQISVPQPESETPPILGVCRKLRRDYAALFFTSNKFMIEVYHCNDGSPIEALKSAIARTSSWVKMTAPEHITIMTGLNLGVMYPENRITADVFTLRVNGGRLADIAMGTRKSLYTIVETCKLDGKSHMFWEGVGDELKVIVQENLDIARQRGARHRGLNKTMLVDIMECWFRPILDTLVEKLEASPSMRLYQPPRAPVPLPSPPRTWVEDYPLTPDWTSWWGISEEESGRDYFPVLFGN